MFLISENTLIIPLKNSVMQSINTKNAMNGNVIKNISPIIRPRIKIIMYDGMCMSFKIKTVFNKDLES